MANDNDWKEAMEIDRASSNVCGGIHMCPGGKFNSKDAKCMECLADSTEAMRQMDGAFNLYEEKPYEL